jgi:hypothetical protein
VLSPQSWCAGTPPCTVVQGLATLIDEEPDRGVRSLRCMTNAVESRCTRGDHAAAFDTPQAESSVEHPSDANAGHSVFQSRSGAGDEARTRDPLPWQGAVLNLYSGGVENGLDAGTYPKFPWEPTAEHSADHPGHTGVHADHKTARSRYGTGRLLASEARDGEPVVSPSSPDRWGRVKRPSTATHQIRCNHAERPCATPGTRGVSNA